MTPHQLMGLPEAHLPLGGDLQGGIACNTLHRPMQRSQLAANVCAWELIAQVHTCRAERPLALQAWWLKRSGASPLNLLGRRPGRSL